MEYPNVSFRAVRDITDEEVRIIYDLVMEHRPDRILEIGPYGGYATLYIAAARNLYGVDSIEKVVSIDYKQAVVPRVEETLEINKLGEVVKLVVVDNYNDMKFIATDFAKDANFILIDTCHREMDDFWSSLEKVIKNNTIVVFHDVNCIAGENMKTPVVFANQCKLYKSNTRLTNDPNGNPNGIGILFIDKEEEVVATTAVEEVKIEEQDDSKPVLEPEVVITDLAESATAETTKVEVVVEEEKVVEVIPTVAKEVLKEDKIEEIVKSGRSRRGRPKKSKIIEAV